MTRARRRVASAPTPRRAPTAGRRVDARPRHGGDRGFHIYARASHAHGTQNDPNTHRGRRARHQNRDRAIAAPARRPSRARRPRDAIASSLHASTKPMVRAMRATRRDATRRAEDEDDRWRARETARGRRGGFGTGRRGTRDVALSDVGDRARRSGRAMASRATPWGSRRARMMGKKFARRVTPRRGRTRARGREDARAMGRRGHRHGDIAIERAVGVRRRANERRRGGVATRTRGATNGARLALSERRTAARRGRRRAGAADRARAGWINHPRARRGGSGLGRDSSSATNSVESTARSAETDRTRARVFRVVYSRSLASPLPRSPPRRSKPSPVASRAKPPPRRLARRPSRR